MLKTVLITGGSSGIGYELAKIFGENNYQLLLIAKNKDKLEHASEKLKSRGCLVRTIIKDLSDPNSPTQIYKQLEEVGASIDILVNNAGFATYGPFSENDTEKELEELQLNIITLTHLTKLILPDMLKRKEGKILNLASTAAFAPGPLMTVYYASKAYVLSFSEALNEELAGSGVNVTALCPGPTDTGFEASGGLQNSKLFKGKNLQASFVAQAGFNGLMKNKSIVIPGFKDKLIVQTLRLAPRNLVVKAIKNAQSKRKSH